jgi:phosphatidylglycerophosphate synthase
MAKRLGEFNRCVPITTWRFNVIASISEGDKEMTEPVEGQKKSYEKPTDGIVAKHLNRHISRRITRVILESRFDVTPNQMSVVSNVISVLGGILLATPFPIIGGSLVQLGSILDGCDGEIARATGRESKSGAVLDAILDRIADGFIILGMTVFILLYASVLPLSVVLNPQIWSVLVVSFGFLALVGSYGISYSTARAEATLNMAYPRIIAGRDVRLFLILIAGICAQILNWAMLFFLIILVVLTFSELVWRIIRTWRKTI